MFELRLDAIFEILQASERGKAGRLNRTPIIEICQRFQPKKCDYRLAFAFRAETTVGDDITDRCLFPFAIRRMSERASGAY